MTAACAFRSASARLTVGRVEGYSPRDATTFARDLAATTTPAALNAMVTERRQRQAAELRRQEEAARQACIPTSVLVTQRLSPAADSVAMVREELRPLLGNRVYGCDDCQLVCPWNKYARTAVTPDFAVRNGLARTPLTALFAWSEDEFNRRLEGSAIRRIGHERWLRNIAVALGNGPSTVNAKNRCFWRLTVDRGISLVWGAAG